MNPDTVNTALLSPFPENEIEWRVAQSGIKHDGTPWAKVLAYVTNRAIQKRLDDTFGPFGWRNEYRFEQIERGGEKLIVCLCGISVRFGDQWVTKWDGAEPTDIESGKGALSDAMKRCAVQWGIGRYLYNLEEGWAEFRHDGAHNLKMKDNTWHRWSPPRLPAWALPSGSPVHAAETRQVHAPAPAPAQPAHANGNSPRPEAAGGRETAPRPSPAPTAQGTASAPAHWQTVIVPPFIKKYAGQTLGDMAEKDLLWWAANYEPRPYKNKIQPKDIAFKAALVAGAAAISAAAPAEEPEAEPAGVAAGENGPDEDVPF